MRTILTLLGLLLAGSLLGQDTSTKAILVLDASGSMGGTIGGRTKIEIAREAVAKVIATLPPGMQMGLMAYGHRRKGDCSDIELLIPPGPVDKQAFLSKVNSLNPVGKTPLTRAVEMAAEILKSEENPATVILVSDGLETCDGDPCALALRLEATGVKFTTHVVAFDLTQQEALTIKCLSETTGGLFLQASNAATLQSALSSAMKSVETKKSGATFRARSSTTGQPMDGATWAIYRDQASETPLHKLDGPEGTLPLEPGKYLAIATWQKQQTEVPFEVRPELMVPVEAAFGPSVLRLQAIETPDAPPLTESIVWDLTEVKADGTAGEPIKSLRDVEPVFELPAGKYRIICQRGYNVTRELIVEVKAGESRTEKILISAGTVNISSSYGGTLFKDANWVEVFALDAKGQADPGKRLFYKSGQPVEAFLPPGEYEVRVERQGAKGTGRTTVEAGKTSAYTLDLDAGFATVKAVGGDEANARYRWWYAYPLDASGQPGKSTFSVQGPQFEGFLNTGEYLINYEVSGEKSPGVRIKVEKGKSVDGLIQEKR